MKKEKLPKKSRCPFISPTVVSNELIVWSLSANKNYVLLNSPWKLPFGMDKDLSVIVNLNIDFNQSKADFQC